MQVQRLDMLNRGAAGATLVVAALLVVPVLGFTPHAPMQVGCGATFAPRVLHPDPQSRLARGRGCHKRPEPTDSHAPTPSRWPRPLLQRCGSPPGFVCILPRPVRARTSTWLQGVAMKRGVQGARGQDDQDTPGAESAAAVSAGAGTEGQLLPKLGKLKDVSRQVRGDILGARAAVKIQGQGWENLVRKPPTIRVAGGTAKGRKLKRPEVYLRPMMGKVKEALFSILTEFNVLREDAIALDTFAGCGSVGIEALSRGVGKAVFVDYSKDACRTIEENLEICEFDERSLVVCSKAEAVYDAPQAVLARMQKPSFDLVTITPPYEEIDYSDLLNRVATSQTLLGDGSVVVVEYPVELGSLPPTIGPRLVGMRNRKYGRTMMAIYCINPV
jgi:16S rRNA (guanine966-N2)-methyltransferase